MLFLILSFCCQNWLQQLILTTRKIMLSCSLYPGINVNAFQLIKCLLEVNYIQKRETTCCLPNEKAPDLHLSIRIVTEFLPFPKPSMPKDQKKLNSPTTISSTEWCGSPTVSCLKASHSSRGLHLTPPEDMCLHAIALLFLVLTVFSHHQLAHLSNFCLPRSFCLIAITESLNFFREFPLLWGDRMISRRAIKRANLSPLIEVGKLSYLMGPMLPVQTH